MSTDIKKGSEDSKENDIMTNLGEMDIYFEKQNSSKLTQEEMDHRDTLVYI